MIYAGVDIAKTNHVVGAVDGRGDEVCRPMPFKNTEAGFERAAAWLEGLAESPSDVVVGMEATGHCWVACYSFLVARGYSVAVINLVQVKAVRKLKGLDKVKNDRVDAGLMAETLCIGQYDETRLATNEVALALPAVAARHGRGAQDPVHMPDGRPLSRVRWHILGHVRRRRPRGSVQVAAALRAGPQEVRLARARHHRGVQAGREMGRSGGGGQGRGRVLDRREVRPGGRVVPDQVPDKADRIRRFRVRPGRCQDKVPA